MVLFFPFGSDRIGHTCRERAPMSQFNGCPCNSVSTLFFLPEFPHVLDASEVISAIGIDPGRMTGKPEVGVRRLGSCRQEIVPGALLTKHSCPSKVLGGMALKWRSGGSSLWSQHSLKFSNSFPPGCECGRFLPAAANTRFAPRFLRIGHKYLVYWQ